jgi:hypothetical protein
MNTSLFAIVKQITAQHGEAILGDPRRLKGFIHDRAKGEPKEDRLAFGRAVEQGFYRKLKRTALHDRARVKAALASRLQSAIGFDAPRCAAALDLLDALTTPVPQRLLQRPRWIAAAVLFIIACVIAAKGMHSGGVQRSGEAAAAAPSSAITPPEGFIPKYAQDEVARFTAEFLRENAAAASGLSSRFFYNKQGEACLEYTVRPRGGYTWSKPVWIGFTWSNIRGFHGEGNTDFTLTKQNQDTADYRMEERRKDSVFWEIEQEIFQIALEYDYDFYALDGRAVKYRTPHVKKAVCEGYSVAVAEALQNHARVKEAEIWVSDKGNHAWNVITLHDGRKLYCDATWYDGNSVDDEGYVVHEPVRNPVDLTFDLQEFNTMGGAVNSSSGRPIAVHFGWGDARKRER